jgi:hypothetical protein
MSHRRTLGGTWSEITKTDVAVNQLWRPAAIMLELSRHSPGAPGARQTTPLQTSASLGPAGLGESRLGTWQHVAHPLLADIGDRRRHRLNGPIGGSCNGLRGTQNTCDPRQVFFFSKTLVRVCLSVVAEASPHVGSQTDLSCGEQSNQPPSGSRMSAQHGVRSKGIG